MDLSAEAFESLNDRLENHAKRWLQEDQDAQSDRKTNSSAMDIYDTVTKTRMLIHVGSTVCSRHPVHAHVK